MDELEKYETPHSQISDKAYAIVRAAISLIPYFGSPAVELLSGFYKSPIDRRREQWIEQVTADLRILDECRQINLNDLENDEVFTTTLIQASEVAVRNHQQEKIQALRNVVMNAAVGIDINEDLKLTFIRYINELTPTHFKLLAFFRENEVEFARAESYDVLLQAFNTTNSIINIQPDEFKLLCTDLISRVLLRISSRIEDFTDIDENSYLTINDDDKKAEIKPRLRVTDIGKKLLDFLTFEKR